MLIVIAIVLAWIATSAVALGCCRSAAAGERVRWTPTVEDDATDALFAFETADEHRIAA